MLAGSGSIGSIGSLGSSTKSNIHNLPVQAIAARNLSLDLVCVRPCMHVCLSAMYARVRRGGYARVRGVAHALVP